MARACGSYPQCPRFESRCRYQKRRSLLTAPFIWPVGQVVKTPPFHGGNMGSSPVRVTKTDQSTEDGLICFAHSPRDSKGAGVNDVPAARQSRDPARPQARNPVRVTTSEQSPLRSKSGSSFRVAGFFVYAPLLLLSKSNPLRWASIWFFVLSSKLADLFCIFSAGLETVPHRQHRRKRIPLAAGFYHFSVSFSALSGAFFNSFIIFPSESRSTGFAIWAVMPASRHF